MLFKYDLWDSIRGETISENKVTLHFTLHYVTVRAKDWLVLWLLKFSMSFGKVAMDQHKWQLAEESRQRLAFEMWHRDETRKYFKRYINDIACWGERHFFCIIIRPSQLMEVTLRTASCPWYSMSFCLDMCLWIDERKFDVSMDSLVGCPSKQLFRYMAQCCNLQWCHLSAYCEQLIAHFCQQTCTLGMTDVYTKQG